MINWLQLTDEERRISIEQASVKSGITAKAIEKDWWVTLALRALFQTTYSKYFIFKGGTSLSKGWGLIERLSEDADIALDPAIFGKVYKKNPSHSYVKALKREGCAFTSISLKIAFEQALTAMDIPPGIVFVQAAPIPENIPDRDPQTLFMQYPSLYPQHKYIADEVKIEFGVRTLKEPSGIISIRSILSEVFPNKAYEEIPFEVAAVKPRNTFLEKAFLLHERLLSPGKEKIEGDRQSRHFYDLFRIMDTEEGLAALNDPALYTTLLEHRKNYIRQSGVNYETLRYETISFIPSIEWLPDFERDYKMMQQEMIYGDSPDFDVMMNSLKLLNGRFRVAGQGRTLEDILERAKEELVDDSSNIVRIDLNYTDEEPVSYTLEFHRWKKELIFESIQIN